MNLKSCPCLETVNTILVNKSSQHIYVHKEHIPITMAMLDTPNLLVSDWLRSSFFCFLAFFHN